MMIKKRSHPRFKVPNQGAKNRKRVKDRWRTQRGEDNKMKLKKQGHGNMPSIGYKNSDAVRFRRMDGSLEVLVHNETELIGIAGKNEYVARLSHDLSRRKRLAMQTLADSRKIRIVNRVQ